MSLCILSLSQSLVLSVEIFSLSWIHSVEGTHWEEKWRVSEAGLQITEARIKGSGAGMEPPQDAILRGGWWVFRPTIPPQKQLILAASGKTEAGWTLCVDGTCRVLGAIAGDPVTLCACFLCREISPAHSCRGDDVR